MGLGEQLQKVILRAAGILVRWKLKVGQETGKSGEGRKAGTLTKFAGPEELSVTRYHAPRHSLSHHAPQLAPPASSGSHGQGILC